MEIIQTIYEYTKPAVDFTVKYSQAFIDGTAWNNYNKMSGVNSREANNTIYKVFAVAILSGILTAFFVSQLALLVVIVTGVAMFSYDTMNYNFVEAAKASAAAARK